MEHNNFGSGIWVVIVVYLTGKPLLDRPPDAEDNFGSGPGDQDLSYMPDPLDEFFTKTKILEKEQAPQSPESGSPGGFLDILSWLLVIGTIGIGLLFSVIFVNPQSRLNPLPPTELPELLVLHKLSSTPEPALPPTWTPAVSPTITIPSNPSPTDTPLPEIGNSTFPAADLEVGIAYCRRDGSPVSNNSQVYHTDQVLRGNPVDFHLLPELCQDQISPDFTTPISKELLLIKAPRPEEGISSLFTPEIQYWEEEILAWAEEYELDPNLIAAVMQIESCGYQRAKSAAGALGLFQVMPQHFKRKDDPYDPDTNAYRGLSWLQRTLKSGGSIQMALAGYNAGIARAKNPYLDWPDETERYVNWGVNIYRDAMYGYDSSDALEHWLSKGGSALCSRAATEQQGEQ